MLYYFELSTQTHTHSLYCSYMLLLLGTHRPETHPFFIHFARRHRPSSTLVDPGGTLLVAGFSQGSLDGSVNAGLDDLLVMSYDVNGTWLWTQLEGGGRTLGELVRKGGWIGVNGTNQQRLLMDGIPPWLTVFLENRCSFSI